MAASLSELEAEARALGRPFNRPETRPRRGFQENDYENPPEWDEEGHFVQPWVPQEPPAIPKPKRGEEAVSGKPLWAMKRYAKWASRRAMYDFQKAEARRSRGDPDPHPRLRIEGVPYTEEDYEELRTWSDRIEEAVKRKEQGLVNPWDELWNSSDEEHVPVCHGGRYKGPVGKIHPDGFLYVVEQEIDAPDDVELEPAADRLAEEERTAERMEANRKRLAKTPRSSTRRQSNLAPPRASTSGRSGTSSGQKRCSVGGRPRTTSGPLSSQANEKQRAEDMSTPDDAQAACDKFKWTEAGIAELTEAGASELLGNPKAGDEVPEGVIARLKKDGQWEGILQEGFVENQKAPRKRRQSQVTRWQRDTLRPDLPESDADAPIAEPASKKHDIEQVGPSTPARVKSRASSGTQQAHETPTRSPRDWLSDMLELTAKRHPELGPEASPSAPRKSSASDDKSLEQLPPTAGPPPCAGSPPPKRPKNAYQLFLAEVHTASTVQRPSTATPRRQSVCQQWKELPPAVRKAYEQEAAELRKDFYAKQAERGAAKNGQEAKPSSPEKPHLNKTPDSKVQPQDEGDDQDDKPDQVLAKLLCSPRLQLEASENATQSVASRKSTAAPQATPSAKRKRQSAPGNATQGDAAQTATAGSATAAPATSSAKGKRQSAPGRLAGMTPPPRSRKARQHVLLMSPPTLRRPRLSMKSRPLGAWRIFPVRRRIRFKSPPSVEWRAYLALRLANMELERTEQESSRPNQTLEIPKVPKEPIIEATDVVTRAGCTAAEKAAAGKDKKAQKKRRKSRSDICRPPAPGEGYWNSDDFLND